MKNNFSEYDLNEEHKEIDLSDFNDTNILLPLVDIKFDKGSEEYKANVYCCYWNEWEGLVRDKVEIIIKDNHIKSYSEGKKLVLYKYDCGIVY